MVRLPDHGCAFEPVDGRAQNSNVYCQMILSLLVAKAAKVRKFLDKK